MDTLHLAAQAEGEVVIRGSKLFCQSSTLCCDQMTLCLVKVVSAVPRREKRRPRMVSSGKNENMEVPLETISRHMSEIWALFFPLMFPK